MTVQVGDKIPSIVLKHLSDSGLQDQTTDSIFDGKKVVLFAVPGAFTPTCTAKHLPGYIQNLQQFRAQGVEIVCLAVNDPFVMNAWAKSNGAENITMMADGNAVFTKALGLEMDGSAYGLGTRAQRFALFVDNGIVKAVNVEKPGTFEVSSAEAMLKIATGQKAAA